MNTMTDNETYNGYTNRETWAFNLHWQNDQGLYNETLEQAREMIRAGVPEGRATRIGEGIVLYWENLISERAESDGWLPENLGMFRQEVGSWWRVDRKEVGEAVLESLDAES